MKKILNSCCCIIFFLIIIIWAYDIIMFRPYMPSIQKIVNNSNPIYKYKYNLLSKIATHCYGNEQINTYTAKILLITMKGDKQRAYKWLFNYIMWSFLIRAHYNDVDRFILWCELVPYEGGQGLNESANFHYGRNIEKLNIKELITIMAIIHSPNIYKSNPEKLLQRVDDLLIKYK